MYMGPQRMYRMEIAIESLEKNDVTFWENISSMSHC